MNIKICIIIILSILTIGCCPYRMGNKVINIETKQIGEIVSLWDKHLGAESCYIMVLHEDGTLNKAHYRKYALIKHNIVRK